MKQLFVYIFFSLSMLAFAQEEEVKWVDIEKAEQINKEHPEKKLFIDFYTDWCGWCKKMDRSTFKDQSIVERLNSEYIPVKFDAESKDEITYLGKTYKFVKSGRSGVHSFAYFMLQGGLSYPSYVVLDEKNRTAQIIKGYLSPEDLHISLDESQP